MTDETSRPKPENVRLTWGTKYFGWQLQAIAQTDRRYLEDIVAAVESPPEAELIRNIKAVLHPPPAEPDESTVDAT